MKRRMLRLAVAVGLAFVAVAAAYIGWRTEFDSGRATLARAEGAAERPPEVAGPRPTFPEAVTDETSHALGVLEPGESCEHTFLIRNEGEAPLVLERGPTSCKCTMSHLPSGKIPPGTTVKIRVASKIEQKEEGPLSHRATILTNDPARPRIEFTLHGQVQNTLAVSPSRIETYTLAGESPRPQEVLVYSTAWTNFVIAEVETSIPEATWQVLPADRTVLDRFGATSGRVLSVQMPPREEKGFHALHLDVTAHPEARPDVGQSVHVECVHEVRTGGSIGGPNFQPYDMTLDLGPLFEGEGKEDHVVVVLRDKARPKVRQIETEPDFLKVTVEPLEGAREGAHVYRVGVEVPGDAPPCNYRTEKGRVRIAVDGQAVKKIEFNVSFAISPRFGPNF